MAQAESVPTTQTISPCPAFGETQRKDAWWLGPLLDALLDSVRLAFTRHFGRFITRSITSATAPARWKSTRTCCRRFIHRY